MQTQTEIQETSVSTGVEVTTATTTNQANQNEEQKDFNNNILPVANEEANALSRIRLRQTAKATEQEQTKRRKQIRVAAKQARAELDRRKTANFQAYLSVGRELRQARKDIATEVARLITASDDNVSQVVLDRISDLAKIGVLAIAVANADRGAQ